MEISYRLLVIGQSGMYTYGDYAASPELAKLVPGALRRNRDGASRRLGVERVEWVRDSRGNDNLHLTLVEAETVPGEWTIGTEVSP
jgi:hypothetical protein